MNELNLLTMKSTALQPLLSAVAPLAPAPSCAPTLQAPHTAPAPVPAWRHTGRNGSSSSQADVAAHALRQAHTSVSTVLAEVLTASAAAADAAWPALALLPRPSCTLPPGQVTPAALCRWPAALQAGRPHKVFGLRHRQRRQRAVRPACISIVCARSTFPT